jgi:hypothetical protein
MKTLFAAVALAAVSLSAGAANAASVEVGAGAKIIAPLQIAKKTDLYFGTIAPSLDSADKVVVGFDGSRKCGPALTCLTADHTAAIFAVSGEMDAAYTVSLPGSIKIANANGDAMQVSDFSGSKTSGTLFGGNDSFSVGGTLEVAANQAAGQYTGSFTVAVEYQ